MITAAIGRIFLDAYNEKYGTKYDAKTFFVEVYHPLFFDSNKYLQWISNSPFVQMKKGQKVETLTPDERRVKLQVIMSKVEENAKMLEETYGVKAIGVVCDVTKTESVEAAIDEVMEKMGRIDRFPCIRGKRVLHDIRSSHRPRLYDRERRFLPFLDWLRFWRRASR